MRPDDQHNRAWLGLVRPAAWSNPTPAGRYNLVVIGAGPAGLVAAVGAASLGARVAIIERQHLGGDCLNVGCVPSKALLASARAAHPPVDFGAAMARLRAVRAGLAKHDSAERLQGLGVDVYFGEARFVGRDTVTVDSTRLRFSRCLIATGARAALPPIPGLEATEVLTNETIFDLATLPKRLTVIGGGPVGCELAQAFRRLGSEVTLLTKDARLLPADDEDASTVVAGAFAREGIAVVPSATIERVASGPEPSTQVTTYEAAGVRATVVSDRLLVAAGRVPNTDELRLDAAGVAVSADGVVVDDRLRTTNRRVYAAGDVCSRHRFTHTADAMARIAIQNALFFGRRRASALSIPWAIYTDPEVAHVGISTADAQRRSSEIETLTFPMVDIDRAVLEGDTVGFARVHVERGSGRILGATMVASHAGELIGEMALAITAGLRMEAVADTIHPYPTRAEAWKKLADAWNRRGLTPRAREWAERLMRWRR